MLWKPIRLRSVYGVAFILIFIACIASSCDKFICGNDSPRYFTISNNSPVAVNWMEYTDSVWTNVYHLNDTSKNLLLPNASHEEWQGGPRISCVENHYKNGEYVYCFFFNHDTVKAIGWDAISGTNRGLLKKVKFDLDYLKNNSYTIAYP